ncbi:Sensor protein gacS [Hordeum vulgare]|nr:Sensor protein gacS [Hordeum vulgare]
MGCPPVLLCSGEVLTAAAARMPVMNGYEATRRIREEESRYGIRTPIIALTANSVEEGLQDAMEAGMDLHLTKPIPKPRIAQIVLDLSNQVQN